MRQSSEAGFSVGPLVALEGGDGEAVTAWRDRIATLGASQATMWMDGGVATVELPNVAVGGARWTADGTAILAGTGTIDVGRRAWSTNRAIADLAVSGRPGAGSVVVRATSWSADGGHVAALLDWTGPRPTDGPTPPARVAILDLSPGTAAPRVDVPAEDASGVLVAGERVVVAAPVVRVWTFAGEEVASLPGTAGEPLWISGGDSGVVFIVDADYSIRVVDVASLSVVATWAGEFLDAVAVPGGLIAVDLEGTLHAARIGPGGIEEIGVATTGIGAARLAVTGDGRLVIVGAGPEPVHVLSFRLTAGP